MKKKTLIMLLVLCMTVISVVSFTAGAAAAGGMQEIKAYLNSNITVTLDGQAQTFKDAKGTRVYPITYGGSTYLPVRAMAGLVGLEVDWDGSTQTVKLGKNPKGVDLIDTYNIYHSTKDNGECQMGQVRTADGKTAQIAGVTQSHWAYVNCAWGHGATISYNLQGKHNTLTFSCYSNIDVTLKVLGDDGLVLGEYAITGGAIPKPITLPLLGTYELTFQAVPSSGWPQIRIFDAYLDAEE